MYDGIYHDDHNDGVFIVSCNGGGASIKGDVKQSLQVHIHLHINTENQEATTGKIRGFIKAFTKRRKPVQLTENQTSRIIQAIGGITHEYTGSDQMPALPEIADGHKH